MQTYSEIEEQIDQQVANLPQLSGLTNSNTGEWKLWKSIFVYASLSLQFLWEQFKKEILGYLASDKIGQASWYIKTSKAFQWGDSLVNNDGVFEYAQVDLSKRIIEEVAPVDANGKVVLKVATGVGDGVLTNSQKAAFLSYWLVQKPFGQPLVVVSELPDIVKSDITVKFDAKLKQEDVESVTESAIEGYLKNTLQFNGNFNLEKYRQALQAAVGELSNDNDVIINSVEIRPNLGVFTTVQYLYTPVSGRYKYATPTDTIPTDRSTITYEPI